jgi:hypothetical protein
MLFHRESIINLFLLQPSSSSIHHHEQGHQEHHQQQQQTHQFQFLTHKFKIPKTHQFHITQNPK